MKRHSYPKRWGRLFERYCAQVLPDRKDEICERADRNYTELMKELPDDGLGENSMAASMETWFCIVAFYEANGHLINGEAFQIIHSWHVNYS